MQTKEIDILCVLYNYTSRHIQHVYNRGIDLHAWETIIILKLMDNLIPISDTGTRRRRWNGINLMRMKLLCMSSTWNVSPAGEFRSLSRQRYNFVTHALIELLISIQMVRNFPNGKLR